MFSNAQDSPLQQRTQNGNCAKVEEPRHLQGYRLIHVPIRGKEKVSTSEAWVQEGSSSQLYTDMKTGWSHAHNSLQGSLGSIVYACAQEEGG